MINHLFTLKIFIVLLAFALTSCKKDRVYDNPIDPNKEEAKDTSGSTSSTSGSTGSPTGDENPVTPTESVVKPGTVYNFAKYFSVTPDGCGNTDNVAVFDSGTGLLILVKANCGTRNHVYLLKTNYEGTAEASPSLVTTDCNSGTTGVSSFAADKGNSGILLAYVCSLSSSSYQTKMVIIDLDGQIGTPSTYETSTGNRTYVMAWNSTANSFGLARSGVFQRFDGIGQTIGGPVPFSGYNEADRISTNKGNWYIYSNCSTSIINQNATLGCDNKNFNFDLEGRGCSGGFASGSETFIGFKSYSSGTGTWVGQIAIDESGCLGVGDVEMSDDINNIAAQNIHGSLNLNSEIGTFFISDYSKLMMVTYPRVGSFNVYAVSSISGFTELSVARFTLIQKKIYAAFAKDDVGYVSYSTEETPD